METLTFQNKKMLGASFTTPFGGYPVKLDGQGRGSAPGDCGLFDNDGQPLLPDFELLDGQPHIQVTESGVEEAPLALARWRALKDYLKGGEIGTPKLDLLVRFDPAGIAVAPVNCGFLDHPHVELVGMLDPDEPVPDLVKIPGSEPVREEAGSDSFDPELDDPSLTDEQIEAILERRAAPPDAVPDAAPAPEAEALPLDAAALLAWTMPQLWKRAAEMGIENARALKKPELIAAVLGESPEPKAETAPTTDPDQAAIDAALQVEG